MPQDLDRAWLPAVCTAEAPSPASYAAYWQIKHMFPLEGSQHGYRHTMGGFADPCSGGPRLPTPECPFPLAPCSTPPHSLHPSEPDHHVFPQLPPGTLHCSASLWPHQAWFDSPSAPPGILLSRVTFSGTLPQTRVILGPGPAALGLTEEGQRPTHPPLGLEAPGGVPVARDEGRGWEEACPPAWVKLL